MNLKNNKRRTLPLRGDSEFVNELKELAKFRYFKQLEKKEPSSAEMTRLLRRTDAYKKALMELRTKPRRENL